MNDDLPIEQLEPMQVAAAFENLTRQAKATETELERLKVSIKKYHDRLLTLIEDEKLSHSFKMPSGANIHLQSQMWASAKDKNHARLAAVLKDLGMVELLPKTVNSHSLSAFVREYLNDDGELTIKSEEHPEGIPQELVDALNITTKSSVKPTGL